MFIKVYISRMEMSQRIHPAGIKVLRVMVDWQRQGRFTTDDGNMMVCLGRESGKRRMGVGFIIEKKKEQQNVHWNKFLLMNVSFTMRMKGHPQGTLDNILKKDVTVLMGDWNAKNGKYKVKTKDIGTFGLGTHVQEMREGIRVLHDKQSYC